MTSKTKKENKVKKELEPGAITIRRWLMVIFVVIATLGVSLGVMNWYGIITPYWY